MGIIIRYLSPGLKSVVNESYLRPQSFNPSEFSLSIQSPMLHAPCPLPSFPLLYIFQIGDIIHQQPLGIGYCQNISFLFTALTRNAGILFYQCERVF